MNKFGKFKLFFFQLFEHLRCLPNKDGIWNEHRSLRILSSLISFIWTSCLRTLLNSWLSLILLSSFSCYAGICNAFPINRLHLFPELLPTSIYFFSLGFYVTLYVMFMLCFRLAISFAWNWQRDLIAITLFSITSSKVAYYISNAMPLLNQLLTANLGWNYPAFLTASHHPDRDLCNHPSTQRCCNNLTTLNARQV